MSSSPNRIDVHHHVLPPDHLADLARRGVAWTGGAAIPNWSVSIAREVMERNGIAAAIASPMPSCAQMACAPITPAAGPDSSMRTQSRRACSLGNSPPVDCTT